jgi:Zn-dependent protease with chaperone function
MQAIGLRTWQWNNAAKTVLLLAGFPVLLVVLTFAFVALWQADSAPSFAIGVRRSLAVLPQALPFALVASAIWFAIAWFAHQRIIDLVTGARPTTRAAEPRLWNLLENLAISRGMTMPSLRIIESEVLNAYASGLTRRTNSPTSATGMRAWPWWRRCSRAFSAWCPTCCCAACDWAAAPARAAAPPPRPIRRRPPPPRADRAARAAARSCWSRSS